MKATEQYFPVVLYIMLYKVVSSFESVNEILKCEYSNGSCRAVLSFVFITSQNLTRRYSEFLFWALLRLKKYHMKTMKTRNVI